MFMQRRRRWPRRLALGLGVTLGALFLLGPYERVEMPGRFDASQLRGGVGPYLAAREARFDDIRPGAEKRVLWYGLDEVPTPLSVVYVHGFSATSHDLAPVPERVAQALGANLVLTRLTGHGRDGAALGGARAGDWMRDMSEALAVARAIGHEVVVIATSTGGTLAAIAALDLDQMREVKGMVLVSPNFGINHPAAPLLRLPAARYWLPLVAGRTHSTPPRSEAQARHWTLSYPTTALLPVAALAAHARRLDYSRTSVPVLFHYAPQDQIVRADRTDRVAAAWGGPVTRVAPRLGAGVDPAAHIVAGDTLSPANTDAMVETILDWVRGLE